MASLLDTLKEAGKAAAKGAADSVFAPKTAASLVLAAASASSSPDVPTPSGIDTPTPSALPSWALPVGAGLVVLFLVSRR